MPARDTFSKLATVQTAVLAELQARDAPMSVEALNDALPSLSRQSLKSALKELFKRGAVNRVARGRYIVPTKTSAASIDLSVLRILTRAVLLAKEHDDMAALAELRRDLCIALQQPERSALWYHGVQALIDELGSDSDDRGSMK